ncbi:MAG: hypothetical protein LBK95_17265 [Bifidobacteriaceae bacterium]|jgi:drug/metabolite transporter (DMT)-like permease|nr:hypothetical protein [Bifidobacteriaceae bacterium]
MSKNLPRGWGRAAYAALALIGVALLVWAYQMFRQELPNYKTDGTGYWTWQELVGLVGGAACLVSAVVCCVKVEQLTRLRSRPEEQ